MIPALGESYRSMDVRIYGIFLHFTICDNIRKCILSLPNF